MTQKRIYQKPAMQVFELKQWPQLLAGSNGEGGFGGDPGYEPLP